MAESHKGHVERGIQYLKGSDQIIGDIIGYCVNAYKADPSPKTIDRIRQYVKDTANSIGEHVLTISHNMSKMLESEVRSIESLSHQTQYVAQRLDIHQSYMSELFMTKFQVYPRPSRTVHVMKQSVSEDKLPRYAQRKRPWVRVKEFDYKILDRVGTKTAATQKHRGPTQSQSKSKSSMAAGSAAGLSITGQPLSPSGPSSNPYQFNSAPTPTSHAGADPAHRKFETVIFNADAPPPMFSSDAAHSGNPGGGASPIPPGAGASGGPPPQPPVPPPGIGGPGGPPPAPGPAPGGPPVPPPAPGGPGGGGPPPAPGGPPVPPPAPAQPSGPPPEVQRFLKMLKIGVPKINVQKKMEAEGLDPALLDKDYGGGGPPRAPVAAEAPPHLKRFLKMLKIGVPKANVQRKMRDEGFDPADLDKYGDGGGGGGRGGGGGPPPAPRGGGPPAVPKKSGGPPPPAPPAAPSNAGAAPPELQRFLKMMKMGVPRVAVNGKMEREGLDPSSLDPYV